MKKAAAERESNEIYETHVMSELSVIFHVDRVVGRTVPTFNWHENIEILYFLEGEADVYHNAELTHATPGDILIFPANCLHAVLAKEALYDCLIVDRGLCLSAGVDTSTLSFPFAVRDRKLTSLYQRVAEEVTSPEKKYRIPAVRGAVLSFMAYLCRNYASESATEESRSVEGIRKAIRYIRDHMAEPITVDRLATTVGFSKFHFAREFKRVTSYTVVTYLNLVRVERAKQLLSGGECSVGEAAVKCGFNNLSYFSKIFRAQTGITPSEYVSLGRKK